MFAWGVGQNNDGVLDQSSTTNFPVKLKGLGGHKILQFAAGNCHSLALSRKKTTKS